MPSDIRSFFGGGGSQPKQDTPKVAKPAQPAKRGRGARKVLEDSDDDVPAKSSPKKAPPRQREPTPKGEQTTASDYFGKNKPKKSEPVRTSTTAKKSAATSKSQPTSTTPKKFSQQANELSHASPNGRSSARKRPSVNYNEEDIADALMLDMDEPAEDVFKAEYNSKSKVDDYQEHDNNVNDRYVKPRRVPRSTGRQTKIEDDEEDFLPEQNVDMKDTMPDDDFLVPDDDEVIVVDKAAKRNNGLAPKGRKRKSQELDEDEDEDEDEKATPKKAKGSKKSTPTKAQAKKGKKQVDEPENEQMQAIFADIPLVAPPAPPGADGQGKKFKFGGPHLNSGPPPAAGSIEIPEGAENCLAGLSFVFTGLLQSLGREEGQALVKKYGGKITSGPSSKTSYVVLGDDAGPSKLKVIAQYNLKTINEEGLFALIKRLPANGGDSKAAAKHAEKKEAEFEKIKQMAAEAEKEERRAGGAGSAGLIQKKSSATDKPTTPTVDTRLWTVKHAPTQMNQICGNKQQVDKLQRWLRNFPRNLKTGFKMAGPDGSGTYRAVIISGPPGIGKTTAAHLVAKMEGYDIVESNASDTRSKKLVETGLRGVLNTTSLLGYFAGDGAKVETSKRKLCLIMDEVDGMSAGDRGGVGALAAICKKTEVPMILICNERRLPKMKPFDFCTYQLAFRRPTTDQIRSRIMTITYREGLKLPPNVVDALIEGTGADIRQIINMVSTAKIDQQVGDEALDYDRGKKMSKAWEKHVILRPWDILGKILGGGMFASSSKATLNDKTELYFNDHEFSYLMLQENYLGTKPTLASNYSGREQALKTLELVEQAASSISDGDLVDRLIHGPEQLWSLMPTHAVFSFVRPASYVAGSLAGNQTAFPSWLGKNSTLGKNTRAVKEIQGHMRLRSSGDRHEIRQQYIPSMWAQLIHKMQVDGKESVQDIIDIMDSYFLTKEDWEAILELGVGPMDQEKVSIDSQTKATFTRLYNSQPHPMPFMKASNVIAPKRAVKEKPDLEEAIDESDEAELIDDAPENDDDGLEGDVMKDKYVKAPKKKKAGKSGEAAGKTAGKGKKRTKAEVDGNDEEDEDEEDVKPKKGKGKAPAKGRGKK